MYKFLYALNTSELKMKIKKRLIDKFWHEVKELCKIEHPIAMLE